MDYSTLASENRLFLVTDTFVSLHENEIEISFDQEDFELLNVDFTTYKGVEFLYQKMIVQSENVKLF